MLFRTAACLLLLGGLLTAVHAQDTPASTPGESPEAVVLGGWALPEGSVVTSTSRLRRNAELAYFPAEGDSAELEPIRKLEIYTFRVDSLETTFKRIEDGEPVALEEFVAISDILEDVREEGQIIDQGRRPTPLSGTRYVAERGSDGAWTRRFVVPEDPTAEQLAALQQPFALESPQYPDRPVRVGEAWEVEKSGIEAMFGALVEGAPQRYTLQLDSLGTFMGRPAGFLSYGLDLVLDQGEGLVMRKREVGQIVRLLDRRVDVVQQWQGTFRTIREGAFEDGEPYRALMEGEIRGQRQQFITVPHAAGSGSHRGH